MQGGGGERAQGLRGTEWNTPPVLNITFALHYSSGSWR